MEEETQVEQETLDTAEEQDTLDPDQEGEDVEALKERLKKAEELAENQRIRAEKAERKAKAKPEKQEQVAPKTDVNGLSIKDLRALQNVHDEDIEQVEKWAKTQGVSIAEAVKDPIMQTYFKTRNEERASAQAANTSTTKRGPKADNGSDILRKFQEGHIPEKDEDIQKLVEAEIAAKKAALKR